MVKRVVLFEGTIGFCRKTCWQSYVVLTWGDRPLGNESLGSVSMRSDVAMGRRRHGPRPWWGGHCDDPCVAARAKRDGAVLPSGLVRYDPGRSSQIRTWFDREAREFA